MACLSPRTAVTPVAGAGTAIGVTAFDATDADPGPAPFEAETVNV